jgi:hypothetical protein
MRGACHCSLRQQERKSRMATSDESPIDGTDGRKKGNKAPKSLFAKTLNISISISIEYGRLSVSSINYTVLHYR